MHLIVLVHGLYVVVMSMRLLLATVGLESDFDNTWQVTGNVVRLHSF